jgi:hypothetical protein
MDKFQAGHAKVARAKRVPSTSASSPDPNYFNTKLGSEVMISRVKKCLAWHHHGSLQTGGRAFLVRIPGNGTCVGANYTLGRDEVIVKSRLLSFVANEADDLPLEMSMHCHLVSADVFREHDRAE